MSLAALVYIGIGDRGRAVEALERAYAERDKFLPLVKIDPRFQDVQSDHRFRALMRRLGLAASIE
jgi:hypothetical protein